MISTKMKRRWDRAALVCALVGLVLVAALVGAPRAASAETCTLSVFATPTSITDPSSWTGCTPDALDDFVVASGGTLFLAGNVDFLQTTSAAVGITIQAGGALAVVSTGVEIPISVGTNGLTCEEANAGCVAVGVYKSFGVATADTGAFTAANRVWRVGDVVPCTNGDCTVDDHIVRFNYPDAVYDFADGQSGDSNIRESIAALVPGEDVVCFWDPTPTDRHTSGEVNFCFEIDDRDGTDVTGAWIDINIRQGDHGTSYPAAQREILEFSPSVDATAGTRTISVADGTFPNWAKPYATDADHAYDARWLRIDDASGNPEGRPYRIALTNENGVGADTIRILDADGLRTDFTTSMTGYIGYGFAPGDPFYVLTPVRISGNNTAGNSPVTFAEAVAFEGVIFDGVGAGSAGDQTKAGLCTPDSIDFVRTWFKDPHAGTASAMKVTGCDRPKFQQVTITGGDATFTVPGGGTTDRSHGIGFDTVNNFLVEDFATRYMGDDAIFADSVGDDTAVVSGIVRRAQILSSNAAAESAGAMQFQNAGGTVGHTVTIQDVYSGSGAEFSEPSFALNEGVFSVSGVWASGVGSGFATLNLGSISATDVMVTDLDIGDYTGSCTGSCLSTTEDFLPQHVDRFVLRDVCSDKAQNQMYNANVPVTFKNGIVKNNCVGGTALYDSGASGTPTIQNVAFINNTTTSATCTPTSNSTCGMIHATGGAGVELSFKNVSAVWTNGTQTAFKSAFRFAGTHDWTGLVTADGILIYGHDHETALEPEFAWHVANATTGPQIAGGFANGPCMFRNADEGNREADYPASTTVRSQPLGFIDEVTDNVGTYPGSAAANAGCGIIGNPGIKSLKWMHVLNKVSPEFTGINTGLGGAGGGRVPRSGAR